MTFLKEKYWYLGFAGFTFIWVPQIVECLPLADDVV